MEVLKKGENEITFCQNLLCTLGVFVVGFLIDFPNIKWGKKNNLAGLFNKRFIKATSIFL